MARARHAIAAAADRLLALTDSPYRREPAETISAELIPLCDALRWIGRRGPRTLAPRRVGAAGRPLWLYGISSRVDRVPRGVVLVIGTWNYPLLLPGVQIAQALAAGNAVLWKPAPGCEAVSEELVRCFIAAGVPKECLQVLGSDPAEAIAQIDAGVDLVVLTGSAATGRRLLHQTADTLTPAIVELSGCDAMIVLAGADLDRVAAAVRFGLCFRGGATCIAPRRLLVDRVAVAPLVGRLRASLSASEEFEVHPAARSAVAGAIDDALGRGGTDLLGRYDRERFAASGRMAPTIIVDATAEMAIMQEDIFAPVAALCAVEDAERAIQVTDACRYGLAASVFGPRAAAERVAGQLEVGCVTVNDIIAPTADPRLPFAGRRESGFGVTRGPEGLLEMTVPRVISVRRGGPTPHLDRPNPEHTEILAGALQLRHGERATRKWSGLRRIVHGIRLTRVQSK